MKTDGEQSRAEMKASIETSVRAGKMVPDEGDPDAVISCLQELAGGWIDSGYLVAAKIALMEAERINRERRGLR